MLLYITNATPTLHMPKYTCTMDVPLFLDLGFLRVATAKRKRKQVHHNKYMEVGILRCGLKQEWAIRYHTTLNFSLRWMLFSQTHYHGRARAPHYATSLYNYEQDDTGLTSEESN